MLSSTRFSICICSSSVGVADVFLWCLQCVDSNIKSWSLLINIFLNVFQTSDVSQRVFVLRSLRKWSNTPICVLVKPIAMVLKKLAKGFSFPLLLI